MLVLRHAGCSVSTWAVILGDVSINQTNILVAGVLGLVVCARGSTGRNVCFISTSRLKRIMG